MSGLFAKKLQAKAHLYFARSNDISGRDAYYVIKVEPAKEAAFLKAMQGSEMLNYASFGEIVVSGFGHEPTADEIELLKREYQYELPQ